MSIGREYAASFGQATQTLNIIGQAKLTHKQLDNLHGGHLAVLLKAAKEDRLPTLSDYRAFLARPARELRAWYCLMGSPLSKGKLISQMDAERIMLRAEGATIDVAYKGSEGLQDFYCDAVIVTPTILGADPFALEHLKHEDRQEYLLKKARELGLEPLRLIEVLHLYIYTGMYAHYCCMRPDSSCPQWKFLQPHKIATSDPTTIQPSDLSLRKMDAKLVLRMSSED